ncbi:MAG: hypothetical protein BWY95_00884 [Bacteroidetes bacterium ADurb.BinA104]|nr:MAG: hypothetical protein BWY95_00884 [Bacteroidetes bacterium ADurb.BinA104]
MLIHVVPPSVELSHLMTDPVCPDSVSRVLLVPVQTVVPPIMAPPTDVESIVTLTGSEEGSLQAAPFILNCTRYKVSPGITVDGLKEEALAPTIVSHPINVS